LDATDVLRSEVKNLKQEKKLLVKEVKSQRAAAADTAAANDAATAQYNALLARCEQLTAALTASQQAVYVAQHQQQHMAAAMGIAGGAAATATTLPATPMYAHQPLPSMVIAPVPACYIVFCFDSL
jgi:chromosome segregation ATPase